MEKRNFVAIFKTPPVWKRVVMWILLFIQFYPPNTIFLPFPLRIISSAIGIGLILLEVLRNIDKGIFINKRLLVLFLPFVLTSILSIVTMNINGTNDRQFLLYFTTVILMLTGGYTCYRWAKNCYRDGLSFSILAYYVAGVTVIQLMISVGMYFSSPFMNFLFGMLRTGGFDQVHNASAGRFLGFGVAYMNLGVANGVGFMMIVLLLKNADIYGIGGKTRIQLIVWYICLVILGAMQARTTLICALISLCFLAFSTVKFNWNLLKSGLMRILGIAVVCTLAVLFMVLYFPDFVASQTDTLNYGFEMFLSYSEGKGLRTSSSDAMSEMLTRWPTSERGWIIGDGIFTMPNGTFYMATDIGFARLIFYFGIFGLAAYYIYAIILVWMSFYNITRLSKAFCIYFTIMLLAINLKSFTEYGHYLAIFLIFQLENKKPKLRLAGGIEKERIVYN